MSQCPCGSTIDYLVCCDEYLSGRAIAKTPEILMRSRYTAYSIADVDYIKKTMQGKPLLGFNETEAKQWATSVQWMGLNVIKTHCNTSNEHIGFVEFIATYLQNDTIKTIHEVSEFHYKNNHWFYMGGEQIAKRPQKKMSRNAPCPCGSQKKFKNCHAQN